MNYDVHGDNATFLGNSSVDLNEMHGCWQLGVFGRLDGVGVDDAWFVFYKIKHHTASTTLEARLFVISSWSRRMIVRVGIWETLWCLL